MENRPPGDNRSTSRPRTLTGIRHDLTEHATEELWRVGHGLLPRGHGPAPRALGLADAIRQIRRGGDASGPVRWRATVSNWFLLLDLIPLLVFVILDSLGRLRWAIVGAVLAAALEIGYSLLVFGEVDEFSYVSLGLIALFGGLSIHFDSSTYFKFKPVILNLAMAGVFIGAYVMDRPLLLMGMERYGDTLPPVLKQRLALPAVRAVLERASLNVGFGLILQAALVGWAALRLTTWWWFATRSAGFYAMMIGVVWVSL